MNSFGVLCLLIIGSDTSFQPNVRQFKGVIRKKQFSLRDYVQVVYASEGRLSRDFFCTPVRKNGSVAGRYKVSKEEILKGERGKENEAVRERLSRVSCLTPAMTPGRLCGKVLLHLFHVFSSAY
jgi:hypothetical protein